MPRTPASLKKFPTAAEGAPRSYQGGGRGASPYEDVGGDKETSRRWFVRISAWHPARLNELMQSVGQRIRLKKADREMVALCCLGAGVPPAVGPRRVSLEIVLGPRQRGGDPDAYWKSTLDALVACGALVDDSKEHVELGGVSYSRGPVKAAVISLEDIA